MKQGEIVFEGKTEKGVDILIRYIKVGDTQILLDYFNTLSKEKTFIRFQGEEITLSEEEKYVKSILDGLSKNKIVKLLVFNKEKLIGVADVKAEDRISSHVGVFGITVAKEFRDKGIGKILMKIVLNEAKKIKKLKIITLGIFFENKTAMKMYKKFGFNEYGKLPGGVFHRNRYTDHIYMFKNICPNS